MRQLYQLALMLIIILGISACGASSKDKKANINDKKIELQKLKNQQAELSQKITALQNEIAKLDPNAVEVKAKLVSVSPLVSQNFTHYIDLQGKIVTDNIFNVTPRGGPGQVKAVYVKEGDNVRKGQLLLKLDGTLVQQQIEQAKIQLSYLKDLYQRRKNLWDQNIGTEVEVITAKNNVANMEKQLALLNQQLSFTNVYAEVSGVAEAVNIRVGETFTGAPNASISIVKPGELKATVDVPENYISRIKKGAPVVIEVPDAGRTFNSTISLISQLIGSNSRSFTAEAKIPSDPTLKPNQVATVKIQDYTASNVIVVPINTIQTDEKGKYVYVMVDEKGKKIALKKQVQAGEIYGDQIEIKQGLTPGDMLITQGFQSIYEGQVITTEIK